MNVLRAIALAALIVHHPQEKIERPPYASNLVVRLLACDWWVDCWPGPEGEQVCAVKWVCPWPE